MNRFTSSSVTRLAYPNPVEPFVSLEACPPPKESESFVLFRGDGREIAMNIREELESACEQSAKFGGSELESQKR